MSTVVSPSKMRGLFRLAPLLVCLCASAFAGNVAYLASTSCGSSMSGYPCSNAVDGSALLGNSWISNVTYTDYVLIDLGSAYNIGNINLYGIGSAGYKLDWTVSVGLTSGSLVQIASGTAIGTYPSLTGWTAAVPVNSSIEWIKYADSPTGGGTYDIAQIAEITADTIPEPGTFVLMGAGFVALGGFLRRRRRTTA